MEKKSLGYFSKSSISLQNKFIFVEGNVGTGKSTFLKNLSNFFPIILEPVDEWMNMKNQNGLNLLEEFYGNQERNAYLFQSIAFRTRIKNLSEFQFGANTPWNIPLVERSIFTDRNVFAKTCFETKKMTEIEWNDYCLWFDWLTKEFKIKPEGYIYLRADPKVSYQRIKARSRGGEETIPFDYLKSLHEKHDEWLLHEKNVLVLDVNEDFKDDISKFKDMLDKVEIFSNNILGSPLGSPKDFSQDMWGCC